MTHRAIREGIVLSRRTPHLVKIKVTRAVVDLRTKGPVLVMVTVVVVVMMVVVVIVMVTVVMVVVAVLVVVVTG